MEVEFRAGNHKCELGAVGHDIPGSLAKGYILHNIVEAMCVDVTGKVQTWVEGGPVQDGSMFLNPTLFRLARV